MAYKKRGLTSPNVTKNKGARAFGKIDRAEDRTNYGNHTDRKGRKDLASVNRNAQEQWTNGVKKSLRNSRSNDTFHEVERMHRNEKLYTNQKHFVSKNVKPRPTTTRKKITKK